MEIFKKYIWQILLVIAVIVIFLQRSCSRPNDTQKIEITIPEKRGELLKNTIQINHKQKDSIVYIKGSTVYTENPINKKLAEDFKNLQKESDSLGLFKKYVDAIQIKKQTTIFDNKDITIEVDTEVQGQLLNIHPRYVIKEQKIKVETPIRTRTKVYIGVGFSDNIRLNNFIAQGEIGLQIKKDIISITADTKQNFGVKYLIKL